MFHIQFFILRTTVHRGAFRQFPFRWIYLCHSGKSTGMETGKTHLCAVVVYSLCFSKIQIVFPFQDRKSVFDYYITKK